MPFEIVRNDITKMEVDAIVNTANPWPLIGSGTDTAIHQAAGPRLLEARQRIGVIREGCSVATGAYDLPAKYVLHTVGPAWEGGDHGELRLLRRAYDSALLLALRLKCRTVAFPLVGAGSYAIPRDQALSVAIQAFTDFLMKHEMQIYLVMLNGKAFELAGSLFGDLKSYIDDNYAEARAAEEYGDEYRETDRRRRRDREKYLQSLYCADMAVCENAAPPAGGAASRRKAKTAASVAAAPSAGLEKYLEQRESSFSAYLRDLLQEKGEKDSEVYRRAQMSRQLFNKILNKKDYIPIKSTVIQLAIGLELDLNQTQKLLEKAGYTLTRSSRADLVVQYFIERKQYNIVAINIALDDCGLPPLRASVSA